MDEQKFEKGTRNYALADVLSRPNTINGLYKKLKLPLEYENLKKKEAIYITHIADLADKAIKEAVDLGEDLDNLEIQGKIQAAVYGGMTGASAAICYHKLLRFLGFHK